MPSRQSPGSGDVARKNAIAIGAVAVVGVLMVAAIVFGVSRYRATVQATKAATEAADFEVPALQVGGTYTLPWEVLIAPNISPTPQMMENPEASQMVTVEAQTQFNVVRIAEPIPGYGECYWIRTAAGQEGWLDPVFLED